MSNFSNRLILYNKNLVSKTIETECIKLLQDIHFIGDKLTYNNDQFYLVGDKFLNLITFCGCSTSIQTDPDENNSNFVAIKLSTFTDKQYFYLGKVPFNYSCSNCKSSINLTDNNIKRFSIKQDDYFTCPECNHHNYYHQINWRRKAGIGQFFIEIHGVFDGEGLPNDELLRDLNNLTESNWEHFYAYSSSK